VGHFVGDGLGELQGAQASGSWRLAGAVVAHTVHKVSRKFQHQGLEHGDVDALDDALLAVLGGEKRSVNVELVPLALKTERWPAEDVDPILQAISMYQWHAQLAPHFFPPHWGG